MKNNISLVKLATTAAVGIMAFALAASGAHAQVTFGIRLGQAPPPQRYEVRLPAPGPGFAWSEGYWEPFQGRYRWHNGNWLRPPMRAATTSIPTGIITPTAGTCTKATGHTKITTTTTGITARETVATTIAMTTGTTAAIPGKLLGLG